MNEADTLSFIKFLKTGAITPLSFDMSIRETYRIVGEPDFVQIPYERDENVSLESKSLTVLFYGNLWIEFVLNKLTLFQIEFWKKETFPKKFGVSWISAIQKMIYPDFVTFFKQNDIHCYRALSIPGVMDMDTNAENYVIWIERERIVTDRGVKRVGITFTFDIENNLSLYKLSSSNKESLGKREVKEC